MIYYQEYNGHKYLPKEERKRILLMSDDFRTHSGIGRISKEILLGLAHHFNFIQLAAAYNHPQFGTKIDVSPLFNQYLGILDADVSLIPMNGYGNQFVLREILDSEKIDGILHITDPRYWTWLYEMEMELQKRKIPLMYLHLWDNTPVPIYNRDYYRACDGIFCISKQTFNFVYQLLKPHCNLIINHDEKRKTFDYNSPELTIDKKRKNIVLSYIPHGLNPNIFFPIDENNRGKTYNINNDLKTDYDLMLEVQEKISNKFQYNFIVLVVNRNIHRKRLNDIVLAYRNFLKLLSSEEKNKCLLLFHTAPVDPDGNDLIKLVDFFGDEIRVAFSSDKITEEQLNHLYNIADVTVNIASNEGFGLSTLESLLAGTPIIINVTGGLQDQAGFVDEKNNYLDCYYHFNDKFFSNNRGKYKKCGEWCIPLWPEQSLVGTPPTPYIFDDRVKIEDLTKAIYKVYKMPKTERKRIGKLGREYVMLEKIGMTSNEMCRRLIEDINLTFEYYNKNECENFYLELVSTNKKIEYPRGIDY